MPYIEEVCLAGKILEVSKYYSIKAHKKGEKRAKRENGTPEAMKRINQRQAAKKLRRLMNNNFVDGDFLVRLDFHKQQPSNSEEMQSMMSKAIRKMKAAYKKAGLEMKYIYVKEVGPKGSRHVHMCCNKCEPDLLRKCWPYGSVHLDLMYSDGQYTKIADYFIKYAAKTEDTEGTLIGKRWYASRNLIQPVVTKRIIKADRFRKKFKKRKGYWLIQDSIRYGISEFTGYEYLSYQMLYVGGDG